jgi:hypothetical protein
MRARMQGHRIARVTARRALARSLLLENAMSLMRIIASAAIVGAVFALSAPPAHAQG